MQHDGDGWVRCDLGHRHWGRYGAAGLLVRRADRVLLQHRSEHVAHPGTWSIPGGARDSHESATEAALREAGEEAGIVGEDLTVTAEHLDDHGGWSYVTVVAHAHVDLVFRPNWEGADLRWVTEDEVPTLPLHVGFAGSWDQVRLL